MTGESYPALDAARAALDLALAGLPLSDQEARTMAWIKGWDPSTINGVVGVLWLARQAQPMVLTRTEEPSTEEP